MALTAKHKDVKFGVGDTIRVIQKIKERGKKRLQTFEGIVIAIKGRGTSQTFTVRRIGVQQIGIEKIFPLASPVIENIEVVRQGLQGVRRAKLYYIREKPRREIEKIYSRAKSRAEAKKVKLSKKSSKTRKNSSGRTGKKIAKSKK